MRNLKTANAVKKCLIPTQNMGYFSLMDRMKDKIQ